MSTKKFEQHPIDREGVLARKGSFWGKWHDRWFVLRGPFLAEYKQQPLDKSAKIVALHPLPQFVVRTADGLTGLPLTLGLFGKKQKNTIFLKALSKTDFNEWMHLICAQSKEGAAVGSWTTTQKAVEAFSKDCVVCTTDRGIIIAINSTMEREFGWKKEEIIGKPVTVLMVKSMEPVHDGFMQRYLTSGERRLLGKPRLLKGAIRKDGSPVTIELSLGEVFEGDQRRFIATMRLINDDEEKTTDESSDQDMSLSESPTITFSDDEEEEEDDVEQEEIDRFESNMDLYVRKMKDNILADFKEAAGQLSRANSEVNAMKKDVLEMKRRLLRSELTNEAMRKILLNEWGDVELRHLGGKEKKPRQDLGAKAKSVDKFPIHPGPRFCFVETLKQMISKEVSTTHSETLLFRTDNSTTSLMTTFAVAMGLDYLEATLGYLVRHLMKGRSFDRDGSNKGKRRGGGKHRVTGFEINPAALTGHEKRSRNLRNLINHCNIFLRAILYSQAICPPEMKEIAAHIFTEVKKRFPSKKESKHLNAVGGWLFLRFFCPAIIFPAQFGLLIPEDLEKPAEVPTPSSSSSSSESSLAGSGVVPLREHCAASTAILASQILQQQQQQHPSHVASGGGGGGCPFSLVPPPRPGTFPPHRGLVLISKFLQNLANRVDFHAEYEKELNELIKEKIPAVTEFLTQIAREDSTEKEQEHESASALPVIKEETEKPLSNTG